MVVSGPPPREVEIVHAGTDGAAPDDVVARLLQSSAPELLHLPRRVVAEGWDNVLVRLGSTLLMRLPRRAQAAVTRHEQLWLPVLAPPLPVAVPVPVHAGRPVADYPWPWSIIRWREGVVASQRPRQLATSWAADLAATFVVLHQPAPPEAPHNPFRAVPLAPRDEVIRERLALGRERGLDLAAAVRAWERGIAAPVWAEPPVWVHGDPHPGNLLVRPGTPGRPDALDALLDWGDLGRGSGLRSCRGVAGLRPRGTPRVPGHLRLRHAPAGTGSGALGPGGRVGGLDGEQRGRGGARRRRQPALGGRGTGRARRA